MREIAHSVFSLEFPFRGEPGSLVTADVLIITSGSLKIEWGHNPMPFPHPKGALLVLGHAGGRHHSTT